MAEAKESIPEGPPKIEPSYYQWLGIPVEASDSQINRARRQAMKRIHPDKNRGDPNAHEMSVKFNNMADTLLDPIKRSQYDESRAEEERRWRNAMEKYEKEQQAAQAEEARRAKEAQRAQEETERIQREVGEREQAVAAENQRLDELEKQRSETKALKLSDIEVKARARGEKLSSYLNTPEGRLQMETDLSVLIKALQKKEGIWSWFISRQGYRRRAELHREGMVYHEKLIDQGGEAEDMSRIIFQTLQNLRNKGKLSDEPRLAMWRFENRLREQALALRYDQARFDMKESEIPVDLAWGSRGLVLEYQERLANIRGFQMGWNEVEGQDFKKR